MQFATFPSCFFFFFFTSYFSTKQGCMSQLPRPHRQILVRGISRAVFATGATDVVYELKLHGDGGGVEWELER